MISKQAPIGSGWGPTTTAQEVLAGVDLSGKAAVVTGGYSGLGLEVVQVLSQAGADIVVPARDSAKAREALTSVQGVQLASLNLIDPGSIDSFARQFLASRRPLHILINSAGIMASPLTRDSRGYEAQFSTNHLGHFQLAGQLFPALRAAEGARVVSVSSRAHRLAGVDFADPNFQRRAYDRWQAYGQSKSANALFAVGLDRLAEGDGVRAFSVHPGAVVTDLSRNLSEDELRRMGALDGQGRARIDPALGLKTVEQGAATIVWCATSGQLAGMGGVYCEDCDVAEAVPADHVEPSGVRPWAIDPDLAGKLWDLSEELTSVRFRRNTPVQGGAHCRARVAAE